MKRKLGAAVLIGLLVLGGTALAHDELRESIAGFLAWFDWPDVLLSLLLGTPALHYLLRLYTDSKFRIWSEKEIEKSRSELRGREEVLRNTIGSYSRSLLSVQDHILTGQSARMGALHSRKIESAQKVWSGLYILCKMKGAASWISLLNWDALAEEAEREPVVLRIFDGLEGTSREDVILKLDAFYQTLHAERLYISQDAWNLCRACASILRQYMIFLCMLRERLPAKTIRNVLWDDGELRKLMSAALPEQSEFIKNSDREHLYVFLEPIEIYLINDLRRTLDGKQGDDWHADKALDLAAQLQEVEDKEMRRKVAELHPDLRSRLP